MSTHQVKRAFKILLIEDEEPDIELVNSTLKNFQVGIELDVCRDGEEAMNYFLKKLSNIEPFPDLMITDIRMPKMNGLELLDWMKSHPNLHKIPIVILTNSDLKEDIQAAYRHHANCYLQKPVRHNDFVKMVQLLEEFWLNFVKLPQM